VPFDQRHDIQKSDVPIVLCNDLCGDFPIDDFGENASHSFE
jgi:hypothetical protein